MNKKTIDIVLPCYNPVLDWEQQIVKSIEKLQKLSPKYIWSVFLVNDGSLQGVSEAHISFLTKNISNFNYIALKKNQGKGAALKKAFAESKSDFVFFTDVDFPYREENILSMLEKLEQNADVVIGIRNESYYKKVPFVRSMLSKGFKKIIELLFKIPTTDTQSGLKAFSKKGKEIVLQTETNRYLFDLELIKRSAKANLKFAFIDLNLKENVVLSKLSLKVLFSEFLNLIKIIFI